jgi:hypothetical protein
LPVASRARLGTALICIAGALTFGTYLAWSFSTRSEEKAQLAEDAFAMTAHEEPRDIAPNRKPPYIVAGATVIVLGLGLVLRKPRPTPITELPSSFWGRATDDGASPGDP